jgi:hypothetical protein
LPHQFFKFDFVDEKIFPSVLLAVTNAARRKRYRVSNIRDLSQDCLRERALSAARRRAYDE